MDGQKGQGKRQWWQTRRKGEPLGICILYIVYTHILHIAYISVLLFLRRVSYPLMLINSRAKYSAESLVYTGHVHPKTLYTPPLPCDHQPYYKYIRILYYPFGITFIAHFECASVRQIPMRMSFRSGFSDRVKEPKILNLRRYTRIIVHTQLLAAGF